MSIRWLAAVLVVFPMAANAAGPVEHSTTRLPLNVTAIVIFCGFVVLTLAITYWASRRSRTASDFLTAGGQYHRYPERLGYCR